MPPAQKRKRVPETSASSASGQSSLRFFFAQGSSQASRPPAASAVHPDSALRRPTTAEEEEADLRRAIEASLRGDVAGSGYGGQQGPSSDHSDPVETQVNNDPDAAPAVIDLSSDEGAQDEEEVALALESDGAFTSDSVLGGRAKTGVPDDVSLLWSKVDGTESKSAPPLDSGLAQGCPEAECSQRDDALDSTVASDLKKENQDETAEVEESEDVSLVLPRPEGGEAKAKSVPHTNSGEESYKAGWGKLGLGRGLSALVQSKDKKPEGKGGQGTKGKRNAPFYKVLRGMPLSVDAFTYGKIEGCQGYFLSHFHSDHYGSLSKTWSHGLIYCSKLTAALCQRCLGVDPQYLRPLDFDVPSTVPKSGGVTVTLIPANHCPGSALFLFEGPCTHDLVDPTFSPSRVGPPRIARYLHCGDFRASPSHTSHPIFRGKTLDLIYLDTTYCNPKYIFPPQPLVIQACVDLALSSVARLLPSASPCVPGIKSDGLSGPPIKPSRQLSLPFAKAQSPTVPPPPQAPSLRSWFQSPRPTESPSSVAQDLPLASLSDDANPVQEDCGADAPVQRDLCTESGLVLLVGTYTIGKERLVLALAEALGTKIFCANPRQRLMWADVARCAADQERAQRDRAPLGPGQDAADVLLHEETALARLSDYLTSNPPEAGIHVVRLGSVSPEQSRAYLAQLSSQRTRQNLPPIRHAMSVRPTGWTFRPSTGRASSASFDDAGDADQAPGWTAVLKPAPARERNLSPHTLLQGWQQQGYSMQDIGRARGSGDGLEVLPIPYSEHSSFTELTAFALSLPWTKIIPTVGVGSPAGRSRMQAHFAQWSAARGPPPRPRGDNYW